MNYYYFYYYYLKRNGDAFGELSFVYELFSHRPVGRVSRRAHADPLIEELNVGDAEEPLGRGTGPT